MELFGKEEKKVEYIELIYDLIFVYMVGRNNLLIHNIENGFVQLQSFLAYILCTLAIIQIWNFTTFYINMFGRNGVRDHIFMFINMYLLYFVGQSTRIDWQNYQTQYHIAWGLIILNILAQYIIELRNHKDNSENLDIIVRMCITLSVEAVFIFLAAIPNKNFLTVFNLLAILSGIILTAISRRKSTGGKIDFMHLTERAMLYVVFTFGEMIIAISSYFEGNGSFDINTIYFSFMAFMIVVGLFLSYGLIYDRLIDREGNYNGMLYMIIHIFIIFSLNNITASLEFMREEEIYLLPKIMFISVSIVSFFVFLFALKGYVKHCNIPDKKFTVKTLILTFLFLIMMYFMREYMYINIFITVFYVFSMFLILLKAKRSL